MMLEDISWSRNLGAVMVFVLLVSCSPLPCDDLRELRDARSELA